MSEEKERQPGLQCQQTSRQELQEIQRHMPQVWQTRAQGCKRLVQGKVRRNERQDQGFEQDQVL